MLLLLVIYLTVHMRTPIVDRACKFNTTERHSERWWPLWFHESEIIKFVLSYLAKKQSCFSLQACLFVHGILISTYIINTLECLYKRNCVMNGTNFNIFTLTVPTLQLICNAIYWYFYRCQHYHKGQLTHFSLVPHICVGGLGHHWFR